jgi:hypothetical protein
MSASGRARSIRFISLGECIAFHKSVRRCTFSQNSALLPKTRARISSKGSNVLPYAARSATFSARSREAVVRPVPVG